MAPPAPVRRQHLARRLHALGPRTLYEALDAVGPCGWRIAEAYVGTLTPAALHALGAWDLPPPQPLLVPNEVMRRGRPRRRQ